MFKRRSIWRKRSSQSSPPPIAEGFEGVDLNVRDDKKNQCQCGSLCAARLAVRLLFFIPILSFSCLVVFSSCFDLWVRHMEHVVNKVHHISSNQICTDRSIPYRTQIHKDLEPFNATGISAEMLESTYDHFSNKKSPCGATIKVYIRNNHFYVSLPTPIEDKPGCGERRWTRMLETLQAYSCQNYLPDMDFVLFTEDGIGGESPNNRMPIFIFQKRRQQTGLLIPYYTHLPHETARIQKGVNKYPWSKKETKLFWRGSTTGAYYSTENWMNHPRSQLVLTCAAEDFRDDCDAGFIGFSQASEGAKKAINEKLGTKPKISMDNSFKYKYLASLDGNGPCSGRIEKFLFGNSVIFKADSDHIEFYYDGLEPNVNYIPIFKNMTDLRAKVMYAKEHDDEMETIARNMQTFARTSLVHGSVGCYIQELFEEYSKLLDYRLKPVEELDSDVKLLLPKYPHGGRVCKNPIYFRKDRWKNRKPMLKHTLRVGIVDKEVGLAGNSTWIKTW